MPPEKNNKQRIDLSNLKPRLKLADKFPAQVVEQFKYELGSAKENNSFTRAQILSQREADANLTLAFAMALAKRTGKEPSNDMSELMAMSTFLKDAITTFQFIDSLKK